MEKVSVAQSPTSDPASASASAMNSGVVNRFKKIQLLIFNMNNPLVKVRLTRQDGRGCEGNRLGVGPLDVEQL